MPCSVEAELNSAALLGNTDVLHPVVFRFFFRVISCEEGKALAESWNAAFMESSAKENQVGDHTQQRFIYLLYIIKSVCREFDEPFLKAIGCIFVLPLVEHICNRKPLRAIGLKERDCIKLHCGE